MRTRLSIFALLLLISAEPALAKGWTKVSEEEGITVFKKEAKSELLMFKGETVLDAPLQKILWVLADPEHGRDWVPDLESTKVLERISQFEAIYYQHYALPWYLSDRDFVTHGKASREAKTGRVFISMVSTTHAKAPESPGVRAEMQRSHFTLTPLAKGKKTRVEVEILSDPKGWIPAWLANYAQTEWPFNLLKGLREQVKKPFVKSFPLPPIAKAKPKAEAKK